MRTKQTGQSMLEALLALPIILVVLLGLVQLIWIFWTMHTLQTGSHYVLRSGVLQHGSLDKMKDTLATVMATTQMQYFDAPASDSEGAAPEFDDNDLRYATLTETLKMRGYLELAARIQIHNPTAAMQRQLSERRWDTRNSRWVQEIAIDHAQVRLAEARDAEAWLAARQLQIEIWWCMPLEVPIVGSMIAATAQWFRSDSQAFCRLRGMALDKPMWALKVMAEGPMLTGFRTR
ncbi:TadE/TadG family type IV pilus assembly protein [Pseudidiomarina sp. PP-1MA]|uniref:TadE/TadG family type IV pilus assembly protein n=1 Tax=Pseudidiomarina sp. PP-1MA TaxID=3237706 RepID=A0AB39X902_9GAMM